MLAKKVGSSQPENVRCLIRVKGGIVLAYSEKAALGSRSRLGAHLIAKKPAQPLSTHVDRRVAGASIALALGDENLERPVLVAATTSGHRLSFPFPARASALVEPKAVAYLRTSSAANVGADKDSEKRQRAAIKAYAKSARFEIADEDWFYDPAVSGADPIETRPGRQPLRP
jgi:Resolvase, N terminal domain